ncbi:HNH endonuclease [Arthrospira platensis C1]|nr:HNH endonuclease [Arthrospira platensis C1]
MAISPVSHPLIGFNGLWRIGSLLLGAAFGRSPRPKQVISNGW